MNLEKQYIISPTIFANSISEYRKKVGILKFSNLIHLDICDSYFVQNKTIPLSSCNLNDFDNQELEIHLMVKDPSIYLNDCIRLNAKRVFIHREIFFILDDFLKIKNLFEKNNIEVALVLNPQTGVEDSISYLGSVKHTMLMSVVPGSEGQSFMKDVLEKVRQIRVLNYEMRIQIDGGINENTSKLALNSGVDILSVGSFISSSNSPKENYKLLLKL